MKVVLLNSSVVSKPRDPLQRTWTHPRVGVASVAAYVRAQGHDVSLLDPELDRRDARAVAERIAALAPAYVGLPAYTEEIHDAALIAEEVKRRDPNIRTVVGGCHVSALPQATLDEFPSIDMGVVGEGERPFADLLDGRPPSEIPGVVFRDDAGGAVAVAAHTGGLDLDALPRPAWDLYELKRYEFPPSIELARYCPYHCAFCYKALAGPLRFKSPEKILDEIGHCIAAYGVRHFYFASNGTYPLDRAHAMAVCRGITEGRLDITWDASTRVDVVDEALLAAMKRAGCSFIDFGIESGDPDVLRRCRKGTDIERIEQTIKLCHQAGIETELNFILGLPHETRQSLENTRRLVARLRRYSTVANFAILTPYPGTEVYEMAQRHEAGLRLRTKDWRLYSKQGGMAIAHDNFAEGELAKYQRRLYLAYYLAPRKILQMLTSRNAGQLLDFRRLRQLLRGLV